MHDHCHDEHAGAHAHGHPRAAAWVEGLAIALVAGFFAMSFFTGRVRRFVAPSYVWLSVAGAGLLAAMAIARLLGARSAACPSCAGEHGTWRLPSWVCVLVLLVPIGLVLAVHPTRYSPEGLRKRQAAPPPHDRKLAGAMGWIFGGEPAAPGREGPGVLPPNPSIPDVIALAYDGRREALEGKFVTVIGQCYLPDGPASRRFSLYRLVVTCCIADATSTPLDVARRDEAPLESGGWVRVQGILRFDSNADASVPVLHATMVSRIAEPAEPYL